VLFNTICYLSRYSFLVRSIKKSRLPWEQLEIKLSRDQSNRPPASAESRMIGESAEWSVRTVAYRAAGKRNLEFDRVSRTPGSRGEGEREKIEGGQEGADPE